MKRLPILTMLCAVACAPGPSPEDTAELVHFASRYAAAWGSQDAGSVAAFFAEDGSLTINGGEPAVGRPAITEAAQGFMTAFPDMVVTMDSLGAGADGATATFYWTLTGTNTGPDGSGHPVRISGHEAWTRGEDGLITRSLGHFDQQDYDRQVKGAAVTAT
jgi:uncharacterized protein (TIGR02246 family)